MHCDWYTVLCRRSCRRFPCRRLWRRAEHAELTSVAAVPGYVVHGEEGRYHRRQHHQQHQARHHGTSGPPAAGGRHHPTPAHCTLHHSAPQRHAPAALLHCTPGTTAHRPAHRRHQLRAPPSDHHGQKTARRNQRSPGKAPPLVIGKVLDSFSLAHPVYVYRVRGEIRRSRVPSNSFTGRQTAVFPVESAHVRRRLLVSYS